MVIFVTQGLDNERSSVAWSVANGAINAGMEVLVFLASAAVDWARKGAARTPHLNPLDPPIRDMIQNLIDQGGTILVCPPCAGTRGYTQDDLMQGATISPPTPVFDLIKQGAGTLSF